MKDLIAQFQEQICELSQRLDIALNVNEALKEEIQLLRDEIARLKGQKPRPKIPPSGIEGPSSKDGQTKKNLISRGKHPRRKKTNHLKIHERIRIKPDSLPSGAIFKGCKKFTVQDLVLQPHNTCYELERWQLEDGTYVTGKAPENIHGHYGPKLICYILHQYYGCRVTEALLLAQLKEMGVGISAGQLSTILINCHDAFHQEKDELLFAGISATTQIKVDDTGARHEGKNGYSTIIGNEYFTYIVSTGSKSRINFLQILQGCDPQYLINEDTEDYIESINPSYWLGRYLLSHTDRKVMNKTEWEAFLLKHNICTEKDIKLATEGALFASLVSNGIPKDLGVHGDDAGQFNVFVRSLCWVHEERHYRKLIAVNEDISKAIERIREGIWNLYNGLKEYKSAPSEALKIKLETDFDDLFLRTETSSPSLNHRLAKTCAKKAELLRVLERPETPLHNNGTETDAREMVVKRKISGGTRSALGQKSRDTFISLKKTCTKLNISFMQFLQDRIFKFSQIPKLATIIADLCAKHKQAYG